MGVCKGRLAAEQERFERDLGYAVVPAVILSCLFMSPRGVPGGLLFYAGAGFCIGLAGSRVINWVIYRRACPRSTVNCIRCSYQLDHSQSAARCPECGLHYRRDELNQLWSAALGARRLDDPWERSDESASVPEKTSHPFAPR